MTTLAHSGISKKGPSTGRILLVVFAAILVVGWISVMIGSQPNEESLQLQPQLKSYNEYPKQMRVSRPAAGYHYPYANQIQQVAAFGSGQAVTVVQKDGQWYQIRISGDRLCWVHESHLKAR